MVSDDLQRRFCRCRAVRRALLDLIAGEGLRVKGARRVWYEGIEAAFTSVPDAEIIVLVYRFLQCSDITGEERAELEALLHHSAVTLTTRQRERLQAELED